jgi:hypothetical protein
MDFLIIYIYIYIYIKKKRKEKEVIIWVTSLDDERSICASTHIFFFNFIFEKSKHNFFKL